MPTSGKDVAAGSSYLNPPSLSSLVTRNRTRPLTLIGTWAVLALVFGLGRHASAQTQEELEKGFQRALRAEPKQALLHLTDVVKGLAQSKDLPPEDRVAWTARIAKVLHAKTGSPLELAVVLGKDHRKQTIRQVLYRKHVEHWLVEAPLRLWVVVDRQRGEDPVIRTIQPWPQDWP